MMFATVKRVKTWAGPVLVASLAMVSVSGCALRPANETFDLSAMASPMSTDVGTRTQKLQILVPTPTALQAINSNNIVVRLGGSEMRYLGGAQWSDQLPAIVQARLAAGLENTGVFAGVGMPGQGLAIDYKVIVEARDFSIDASGPGAANVVLSVKLLNDRTGAVKAQKLFASSVAVNANSSNGVLVAALDQSFAQAQAEIVQWIVGNL